MKNIITIKIVDGKLMETKSTKGYQLEWDGLYYNYYGRVRNYTYEGKTYNCFPVVKVTKDLKVVDIVMFGCPDHNHYEDDFLYDIPVDYDVWSVCKKFADLLSAEDIEWNTYQMIGMILHPMNHPDEVINEEDYNFIREQRYTDILPVIDLLRSKYAVKVKVTEDFQCRTPYFLDEDVEGIYLFKRV